jgi:peptide-methionine (S)-S-oxide reductase
MMTFREDPMTTTVVLAGGCFWCLDAVYRTLRGVEAVVSGYTGGDIPNPSYEAVCTGTTGHAEVVAVTFDESILPLQVVLDVFFTLHDPRQLNRQGNDVGTQYRSAMYFTDEQQRQMFAEAIERAAELWDGPIVTELTELGVFYPAEDYHQDYFAKNPGNGYCSVVAVPKVVKVRAKFAEYAV